MSNTTTPSLSYRFSPRATRAALGIRLQGLNLFGPVRDHVHMAHKTVSHSPVQQWDDACIALLAGAHGLVESHKRLRSDPGLHAAFGRQSCAEPSVGQETLDAGTEVKVTHRHHAMDTLSRRQSQGARHNYPQRLQGLDVDRTGMPCGNKAALAPKGSWAQQRNRRGRHVGRVLATRYDAIVGDRLCRGTMQLTVALQPLVVATEQTLDLDDDKRHRTLWRMDAGGAWRRCTGCAAVGITCMARMMRARGPRRGRRA